MRWDIKTTIGYSLNKRATLSLLLLLVCAVLFRLFAALLAWQQGNASLLAVFSFSVLFPAAFILYLLLFAPAAKSVEGVYMLFGSAILFLLMILFNPFALHLLLGWPVVFLLVELYVTKLAVSAQQFTQRLLVVSADHES